MANGIDFNPQGRQSAIGAIGQGLTQGLGLAQGIQQIQANRLAIENRRLERDLAITDRVLNVLENKSIRNDVKEIIIQQNAESLSRSLNTDFRNFGPFNDEDVTVASKLKKIVEKFRRSKRTPQDVETFNLEIGSAFADVQSASEISQIKATREAVLGPPKKPVFQFTGGGLEQIGEIPKGGQIVDPNKATREISGKLRTQFLQESRQFSKLTNSFQRVRDSARDPSPAGDLALIFNFMKILDPGSVVRESEFATAENAGNVPERIRALYNKHLRGQGRLSSRQRADFLNRAEKLFKGQLDIQKDRENEFRRLATASGADPSQVIVNIFSGNVDDLGEGPIGQPRTAEEFRRKRGLR